jgi:hypothetical protein
MAVAGYGQTCSTQPSSTRQRFVFQPVAGSETPLFASLFTVDDTPSYAAPGCWPFVCRAMD